MAANKDTVVRGATTALSLLFAGTLMATIGVIVWPAVAGGSTTAAATVEPAYRSGDAFDGPADWYAGEPYTLVLFAQSTCGACQKAHPYLTSLVSHLAGRAHVVLASPLGRSASEIAYARALGVPETSLVEASRSLRAQRTPTLVVVNREGQVLGSWEGVGPDAGHAELTASIDRALSK